MGRQASTGARRVFFDLGIAALLSPQDDLEGE
jgi:hypothetical protein